MLLNLTRNDISPALTRLARTARRPRAVFLAMGNAFKSITEGTFNSVGASFRPIPWKNKIDGTPSTLKKTGALVQSFHLTVTDNYAKLANSAPYAAIHQQGGVIEAKGRALTWTDANGVKHFAKRVTIPPRPFFPVTPDGQLTPAAQDRIRRAGERAIRRESGV